MLFPPNTPLKKPNFVFAPSITVLLTETCPLRVVKRFKGRLVKMIKDINGRFDVCSISPKIRQILFHWDYGLAENNLL